MLGFGEVQAAKKLPARRIIFADNGAKMDWAIGLTRKFCNSRVEQRVGEALSSEPRIHIDRDGMLIRLTRLKPAIHQWEGFRASGVRVNHEVLTLLVTYGLNYPAQVVEEADSFSVNRRRSSGGVVSPNIEPHDIPDSYSADANLQDYGPPVMNRF